MANCSIIRNKETKEIERVNAPNGKESILYKSISDLQTDKEEALKSWAQVYTPSFKQWFGDWEKKEGSKVVDENGEPLLVYHGTGKEFSEFKPNKEGLVFFTPNKEYADIYAQKKFETHSTLKPMLKEQVDNHNFFNRALYEKDSHEAYQLQETIGELIDESLSKEKIVDKIFNSNKLKDVVEEPNYERGYLNDSGDEDIDAAERAFYRGNEEYESRYQEPEEEVYANKEYLKEKKEEEVTSILKRLKKLQVNRNKEYKEYFKLNREYKNDVIKQTSYPTFLNIKNPQYIKEPISNEEINSKGINLEKDKDGIIGEDAEFYQRVGGKKVYRKGEKIFAIKDTNQTKSVFNQGTFSKEDNNIYKQKEELPASKASPETIAAVKDVIKRMGIKLQPIAEYLKGNPNVQAKGADALADVIHGIIAVAEGKENVALTEEMVHVATTALELWDPMLTSEMINKIGRFKIYQQVLNAYKDDVNYQTKDGKPDIRKIKKEAVDKLITELIINKNEGNTEFPELREETNKSMVRTWWQKILDWFRSQYQKINITPFEKAANKVMDTYPLTVYDQNSKEESFGWMNNNGIYFHLSDEQKRIQQEFLETGKILKKVEGEGKVDPMFRDTEEADNWYEHLKPNGVWEKVKRVTDRVKKYFAHRFPDKHFTPEEIARNEMKRKFGVKGHAFLEEICGRYFNEDGTKRDVIGPRPVINDKVDDLVYSKLERYFSTFIDSLSKDGKTPLIFSERMIYDPTEKEAGTLDLIAIDENGKAHIIDWKFLEAKGEDIAQYKQGAFQIQLSRYKEMLKDAYSVKDFGMIRAIPFLLKIERENSKDKNSPYVVKGITAGTVDTSQIEDLRLVPVSEKSESTGIKNIDEMLGHINDLIDKISSQDVTSDEERDFKSERLKIMRNVLRQVQGRQNLAPVIETIEKLRTEGDDIISDWNTSYKDRPASTEDVNDKELSDFSDKLRDYLSIANVVSDFSTLLDPVLYDDKTGEDILENGKEIADGIARQTRAIQLSAKNINQIMKDFIDKFVGERNNVPDFSDPEPVLKAFLKAKFYNVTQLPLASIRILTQLVEKANLAASRKSFSWAEDIMAIRKKFVDKGDVRKLTQQIYQKDDKGKIVNKLIYKYSKDFYDMLKANAEEGQRSKKLIKDNIDLDAYKKRAKQILEGKISYYTRTYKSDEAMRDELIKQEVKKWDIDGDIIRSIKGYEKYEKQEFNGWDNWLIDNYPLEKWYSEEYKNVLKDENLNSLYNIIDKLNNRSQDVGYIDGAVRNTFLPWVRRTTAEAITWGVNPSIISNWFDKLKVSAEDYGREHIDKLTKEVEYSLPRFYTYDFTRKDDGTYDTSEVSEDLFKNLIMYADHMEKYSKLKDIEGQIKTMRTVEEFKNHLRTNRAGEVGDEKVIEAGNEKNLETLDRFIGALFYGQKYSADEDITMNLHPFNAAGKLINKITGKEIFKVDEKPDPYSITKCMEALNSYFRLKILGGKFTTGAAVFFGSNMQVLSQAGRYFTEGEFLKNTITLLRDNKFNNDDERKMFLQLIDTFVPVRADRIKSEIRKASINKFSRVDFNGILMSVLTEPSEYVEKSIFMSLLDNMMIENGKITNINDFVKNKYGDRWESAAKHKELSSKIKSEISELKKTRSINAIKTLDENGKLVIPGFDMNNTKEIDRLTSLTRNIARTSTHGRTSSDVNQFGMTMWGNSMQVFKTWIPKLMITRFQHFEPVNDNFNVKINDDGNTDGERYDIGRLRLCLYVFGKEITTKASGIISILSANEKGVETLNQMYEDFARDYKYRTGHKMNMNKDEFFDLIRTNLRNEVRELAVLFSLMGALFSTGFFAPANDEDKAAKNAHNYYVKIMDKFVTQLSFFYNPVEFQNLLSGGMFPALGILGDMKNFTHNMIMETTGFDSSNPKLTPEEVAKKAQPIKYMMEMFPLGSAFITYMSMFDADFAKEYNVAISKNNQR